MTESRSGVLAVLAQQGALLRRNLRKPIAIESRRIAAERMITLEFPHCGAFFAEYSSNISMTGMFIRTDRIQSPGTVAAFEFNLADGSGLIRGEAEVVWVRQRHEAPDRPAGLGLRFVRLDDVGRQQIRRAVEKRLRDSGDPSEIDEPALATVQDDAGEVPPNVEADPVVPGADDQVEPRLRAYARAGAAVPAGGRWRWPVFGAVAALLAAAVLFLYQDGLPRPATGAEEPVDVPAPARANVDRTLAVPPPASSKLEQSRRQVVEIVMVWAEAWSMQQVDDYLSLYAESYRPPDGMSRSEWSVQRRDRISGPRRIEVGITDLEVEVLDATRARARFQQAYASDRYHDSTRKVLDLVLEGGQWRIQDERTVPAAARL